VTVRDPRRLGTLTVQALLLAGLVAGCVTKVPVPPDSAPPEVVLEAYLQALVAGDCETVSALRAGGGDGLCGALEVSAYTRSEPEITPDGRVVFSTTLTTSGGDGSFPDGDNLWRCWLSQQPDGGWRVTDEGGL